jgi:HEAT repeat protein
LFVLGLGTLFRGGAGLDEIVMVERRRKKAARKGPMTENGDSIRSELDRLRRKSTRMDAVARLGEIGAVEAVEPLLRLCRRVKRTDREAIARALAQVGKPAVKPLARHGLEDKSDDVRRCAAYALALMGRTAQQAGKPLLERLADKVPGVRLQVIDALGMIGETQAIAPLVSLLAEKEEDVREHAAEALGQLGDAALGPVSEVFQGSDSYRARVAAAYALSRIGGEQAVALLRRAFEDRSLPPEFRIAILSYLKDLIGADVVPITETALGETDKRIRRQAARCLCELDTPATTSLLMSLYVDEDKKVRAWALRGLRARYKALLERLGAGETSVFPALVAAWRSMEKPADVRKVSESLASIGRSLVPELVSLLDPAQPGADVIDVLAHIGPDAIGAYEDLVAQLDHPDVATCCAAARALGAMGDERAIPVLAARLSFDAGLLKAKKHKDKFALKRALALQRAAAEGLGRLGRSALVVALDAARSDDPVARLGGVMALGHIGGGRALATIERLVSDPEDQVRAAAADALERAAERDVTRLGKMLKSEDDRVRAKAVGALGKLDDLRSLDLLLRAYGDPSARVNKAVVEALARREGERAHSVLIAAAAGGNTTALRALQEHPVREAIPALVEALDSPWSEVYSVALEAICTYVDAFGEDETTMAALRDLVPELAYLLHDDSAKTRRVALQTLGAFRDPTTVRDVADLLLDTKRDIQLAAARVLASIGGEEAAALAKEQIGKIKDEDLRAEIEDLYPEISGGDP